MASIYHDFSVQHNARLPTCWGFFELSYHSSTNICLLQVWLKDAAKSCGGHTAGKHIFKSTISYPSDQYQQCKNLASARIFATVDCKHLKILFWMAKCAQHFDLAGCAACISSISLYVPVQKIGKKSFASIPPVLAGEDVLRIIFCLRIKCLVSHTA